MALPSILLLLAFVFGVFAATGFALVLMIGNAVIKPILAILTLPLIIITLGLAYFALRSALEETEVGAEP